MNCRILILVILFAIHGCMSQDSTIPSGQGDDATSGSESLEKSEGKKKKKKNKKEDSEEEQTEESAKNENEFPTPSDSYTFPQNMLIVSTAIDLSGETALTLLWQLDRKKSDSRKVKERPFIIVTTDEGPRLILNLARGKDNDFRDQAINFDQSIVVSSGSMAFELTKKGKIKEIEISEKRPDCSLKVDLDSSASYLNELFKQTENEITVKISDEKYDECPQKIVID